MAQFKAIDGFNSMDTKELTGYLYQLNEQLKYMFNNLTPEDNIFQSGSCRNIWRMRKG